MKTIDFKQETENLKKSFIDYLDMVIEMVKGELKEDNPVILRNESILEKGKEVLNSQNELLFNREDIYKRLAELKNKDVLFTTEDGFPVYKGDKFWCVHKFELTERIANSPIVVIGGIDHKCFHSKYKADEFLLMNKPLLSLQDILNDGIGANYTQNEVVESRMFTNLKKLATSKLNNK
jgi:hypothetical protein